MEIGATTTRSHGVDATRLVASLSPLVVEGAKFSTILADPPWPYSNGVSRGAARNHYSLESLDDICRLPVSDVAAADAHLHLWTTNAFLRQAFDVIDAWGFSYRSCLVWVKPQLGTGNYWRVSHEFLLLGIRGKLTFPERTHRSWLLARRRRHSAKPKAIRRIIERVSPPPYLELYGRDSMLGGDWTVYGNQLEPTLWSWS